MLQQPGTNTLFNDVILQLGSSSAFHQCCVYAQRDYNSKYHTRTIPGLTAEWAELQLLSSSVIISLSDLQPVCLLVSVGSECLTGWSRWSCLSFWSCWS